ncbi:DUF1822 family protein [Capilliphycus salinus ALCB114379]|uniref:DUF1822 family protein n=1 Tax=Capilliphycus salinus TaxID=2768948 RepID=UPI0039A40A3D
MNPNLSSVLPIPISQDALRFAKQFATEQATPQKGKQVFLNTLAVVAVRDYLRWLSISTAIDQGDCWHRVKRSMFNVADLVLPPLGKLECIPILPGQNDLEIAPEVTENRLGYIAVKFGEDLKQVELLGFASEREIAYPPEPITLEKLNPIDDLIDTLDWHRKWINLWQHLSQPEWQPLELLPTPNMIRYKAIRQPVRSVLKTEPIKHSFTRGKVIEWKQEQTQSNLLLRLKVGEYSEEEVNVNMRLDLLPEENKTTYLPKGLEVSILDESGVVCMNTQARDADQWIELEFSCLPQEQFSLQILVNGSKMIETFRI